METGEILKHFNPSRIISNSQWDGEPVMLPMNLFTDHFVEQGKLRKIIIESHIIKIGLYHNEIYP